MRRGVAVAVLFLAMAMGIAGLVGEVRSFTASAQQKPETVEVKIDNFSFGPAELTVAVGTDKVFKSKVLDTDEKFSYTFTQAGSFPYFCSIHPKMTGKVVVK